MSVPPIRSLFRRLFCKDRSNGRTTPSGHLPPFTPNDQAAIALFALLAIVGMAMTWIMSGGYSGGLVNIDEAKPLNVTFQTDINRADWTELMQLPEIGETMAKRIVESRKEHGPFKSRDDLQRVSGIGPKTLQKIRPYLRAVH